MALTLIEAAKLHSGDVIRSAMIEIFAMNDDLLANMPFDSIEGNALRYNREDTLPGVAFRGLNESYTESTGVINPLTESLVIAGGDLDVDKFLVDTMGADQRSSQEAMKAKKLAHTIGDKMIKGDSSVDPREFDGLQVRLTGPQIVEAIGTPTDGGDPLSLEKLDEAIDATDDPNFLYMSKAMRRKLTVANRTVGVAGTVTFAKDAFGRPVTMYNDLPILIADRNSDVFTTLAFDELGSTGATATATSMYVLSLREGMLQGIQNGVMDVRDLGELESKSVLRTRVEWYPGMTLLHPRAATRLRGISDAPITV
tara:strand:- start:52635 stop:53570 length:936 start_codon:yes stop_codon:yes gene_type:complete